MTRAGFTLLEISIVLVIVGLIIGGILVGRDMIEQATIRSQISQITTYNLAVKTFKIKYNCLPGDCLHADSFGFQPRTSGVVSGEVLGDDVIGASGNALLLGEQIFFWRDLSDANLISDTLNTVTNTLPPNNTQIFASGDLGLYLPRAKIGNGGFVNIYSGAWHSPSDRLDYFCVSKMSGSLPANGNTTRSRPVFTVLQAYSIDTKLDDGLPQTGHIFTFDGSKTGSGWSSNTNPASSVGIDYIGTVGDYDSVTHGPITAATSPAVITPPTSTTCYDNGNTPNGVEQYSLGTNGGSGINCNLTFQFQ
jgi:prepilin-type N-terminal cleavage/methylation domain-containing protein